MNPEELRADAEGVEQGIAEIADLIGLGPDDEPDSPARRCAAAARRLADVIEFAELMQWAKETGTPFVGKTRLALTADEVAAHVIRFARGES